MEIDKSKLKLGIWYEDENGNLIKPEDDLACEAPEGARTYHSCFPLQITEHVYVVHVRVATKGLGHSVKIIGNFIKDEWFDYESFFEDEKPPFVED